MPLAISLLGAAGKMGKCITLKAMQDPGLRIAAATTRPRSNAIRTDLGILVGMQPVGISLSTDLAHAMSICDVAIDFSVREAVLCHVEAARAAKRALVIGTTGLSHEEKRAIESAAQDIPIVLSSNFSLGIALCLNVAAMLGKALAGKSAIDIFETHHVHKKDQPSGTSLALAEAVGLGNIAIHSQRSGETIGEHLLVFECGFERIEIKHIAHSREAFASGALLAAKKLAGMPAGLYTLNELFLDYLHG